MGAIMAEVVMEPEKTALMGNLLFKKCVCLRYLGKFLNTRRHPLSPFWSLPYFAITITIIIIIIMVHSYVTFILVTG